jgi:hypothetical protein
LKEEEGERERQRQRQLHRAELTEVAQQKEGVKVKGSMRDSENIVSSTEQISD